MDGATTKSWRFSLPKRKTAAETAMGVRDTYAWKLAREKALRGATICDKCRRPLDFKAPPRSKWAPSVDHIVPLVLGGAPYAQSNLRVLHVSCNSALGGRLSHWRRRPVRQIRVPAPAQEEIRADWW